MNGTVSGSETGPVSDFGVRSCSGFGTVIKTWGTGTGSWTAPQLEVELVLVMLQALALILGKLEREVPGSGSSIGLNSGSIVQFGSTTETGTVIEHEN